MKRSIHTLQKLLLLLLVQFISNSVLGINPPSLTFPANFSDSLNPAQLDISCTFSTGATSIRYQVSTTNNFSTLETDTILGYQTDLRLTQLALNQNYYWRAKHYNFNQSDSSVWTAVYTFQTIRNFSVLHPDTLIGNVFEPRLSPLDKEGLQVEFLIDTIAQLNSPFSFSYSYGSVATLPVNKKKYFYKYRTIAGLDTSLWSQTKTVFSNVLLRLRFNSLCGETGIRTLIALYGGPNYSYSDYNIHFKAYYDLDKTQQVLDTILTRSNWFYFYPPECRPIYIEAEWFDTLSSIKQFGKHDLCGESPFEVHPFGFNDSFTVIAGPCMDSVQFEFDIDSTFSSNEMISITEKLKAQNYNSVYIHFPKDPINYVYRCRVKSGIYWAKWHYKGALYERPQVSHFNQNYADDESKLSWLLTTYYHASSAFSYQQEYHIDTSESFDSPKHKTFTVPLWENLSSDKRVLFGDRNYIRMRLVSDAGTGKFSDPIFMASTKSFFLNPVASASVYPYENPRIYPYTNLHIPPSFMHQYSTDPSFPDSSTLTFYNDDIPITLVVDKSYYVRARVLSDIDTSAWTIPVVYQTSNEDYLLHPFLISPPDSSRMSLDTAQTFTWHKRGGDFSERYYFVIYEDSVTRPNVVYFSRVDDAEQITIPNLKPQKTYYWTVLSVGETEYEDELTYWNFTTSQVASTTSFENDLLVLFPNPSQGRLYFKGLNPKDLEEVRIFTTLGEIVLEGYQPESNNIPIDDLDNGSYFMRVVDSSGHIYTKYFQIIR